MGFMRVVERTMWYYGAALTRIPPRRRIHGILVGAAAADHPGYALHRMQGVLECLRDHDRRTFDRVHDCFPHVLLVDQANLRLVRGYDRGLCVVNPHSLEDASMPLERVALALAWQSMAVRLRAQGLRNRPGTRAPFYVLCALAQYSFADRLPIGDDDWAGRAWSSVERWARGGEAEAERATYEAVEVGAEELGFRGPWPGRMRQAYEWLDEKTRPSGGEAP